MSPLAISLIAYGCIIGGMVLGMFLRGALPEHHLSDESKDVMKLGIGMIATLAAVVLGLLIASAKGNFDTISSGLTQTGLKIISLDRIMAQYGPETKEVRDQLRRGVAASSRGIGQKRRRDQRKRRPLIQGPSLRLSRTDSGNCPRGTTSSAGFSRGPHRYAATLPNHAGCSSNKEGKARCRCRFS